MKQAMNFRFSPKTVVILHQLEEALDLSRTAVLEEAVQYFAKKKLSSGSHPLLSFAGKLNKKDADDMLEAIKSHRRNKDKEIKL